MAYRLDLVDDPAAELRRVAREQIQDAIEQIETKRDEDPVDAVHEARKSLKKTRSVLRLARPALPAQAYRRENNALRDIARAVSGVRDADVMVETVDGLKQRFSGDAPASTFTPMRRSLAARARQTRDLDDDVVDRLVDDLNEALARVDEWPLDELDWRAIEKGAARAYKRGVKTRAAAIDDPTAENLHEWRKRVKDLWYHERLLRNAWPAVMKAQAEEAHALSDHLGDHHDLSVLAEELDGGATGSDTVAQLAAQRRAELLEQAVHAGDLVYAESPKAFARRLRRYVRTGLKQQPGLVAA